MFKIPYKTVNQAHSAPLLFGCFKVDCVIYVLICNLSRIFTLEFGV